MERWLEQVRTIVAEGLRGFRVSVFLFGSRARGEALPQSDVDIGVLPHEELPPGLLSRIRERLEESSVPWRVELVDLSEVDPDFRQAVLQEGVCWIGSEPVARSPGEP